MSYIKLHGYFTKNIPGGVTTGIVGFTVTLKNGDTVDFPLPFVPSDTLIGVAPAVELSGDVGIRSDFTRWTPVRTDPDLVAGFPFCFADQAVAVKVGRAFEADPATSWSDSAEAVRSWLETWFVTSYPPAPDAEAAS